MQEGALGLYAPDNHLVENEMGTAIRTTDTEVASLIHTFNIQIASLIHAFKIQIAGPSVSIYSTGGPRYIRSFYLQICVYAIENDPFLEPILYFMVIFGLFICEFVICETYFTVPVKNTVNFGYSL